MGGVVPLELAICHRHTHLAFNVAHNLYSGYRGYRRALPPWLATGLEQSGLSHEQAFEHAFGHGYAELEQGFARHFGARKKRR